MNFLKRMLKGTKLALQDEVKEIKELQIQKEDTTQARVLVKAVKTVASSYGIPIPKELENILIKAMEYGLRDAKDGLRTPEKLLVSRIIHHCKESKS